MSVCYCGVYTYVRVHVNVRVADGSGFVWGRAVREYGGLNVS